jgi:hypothetical protein
LENELSQGMGQGLVDFDRKHLKPLFIFDYTLEKEKEVDKFDE